MNIDLFLLIIVVITALAFDFTNGFHDTGNAMATSIASGALKPKAAVALSAVLNLVGAFMSTAVAATIAKGLIDGHIVTLELVFAGLVGGIVWNLMTWLLGIPSSSSHALIGGIVGATIAAVGGHGVIWKGLVSNVLIPAVVAAILAIGVGALATWLVYRITRGVPNDRTEAGFRRGQMGLGLAGLAGARHQRRAEDDGHHLPGADVLRLDQQEHRGAAAVGHRGLRVGDGGGHLPGRLADHPHPGQGTGRDQVAARHGRRIVLGRSHSAVRPLRLRAVDHAGLHRFGAGQRAGQARRRGALGRGRPDGGPRGWSRFRWPGWSGRSPTGSCTSSGDTPARSSASGCWSRSRPPSTSGRARSRSTPRTSTPNGKAASPPVSKTKTRTISRPPHPGPKVGDDTVSAGNPS